MGQEDIQDIYRHLAAKKIRTRLIFPDGAMTPEIAVPKSSIKQYVKRLRLTRSIPEKIARAVKNNITGRQLALRAQVRLRNSGFCFSENIMLFLCSCLEKMPVKSEKDLEKIQWVIDFLDRADAKTAIYTSLMEEKSRAAEMLKLSSENEQRLSRQPVEALIMQGINIPCISADEAIQQISMIDQVALSVFGTTETAGLKTPVNLGVFEGRSDIDKVIRILS
ncbi:MAG: hypothetical protein K9J85_09620 [Desulfobacteraceae bacterium]|nr:hypothetical protein [Desulfobacteraceae bacterium]